MIALWEAYWSQNINTSNPKGTAQALGHIFNDDDIKYVLEGAVTPENKQKVLDTTNHVMNQGGFGAPWFTVVNAEGEIAQFWGNDRWDHVFHHLRIPFQPITIIPPNATNTKASKL
jgi:glutathione S-transferase kappa 1